MQDASATFADPIVVDRPLRVPRGGVVPPQPLQRATVETTITNTPASAVAGSVATLDQADVADAPIPLCRSNILDATDECMRRYGYDGTTIRRIAGELRCAVGSIYRYFGDKRELLMALAERRMSPAAMEADSDADLDALIRRYLDLAGADFEAYQLLFWLAAVRKDAPLPVVIQQVIAGLERRLGSPRHARLAWTLLHGAATTGQSADDTLAAVRALTKRRGSQGAAAPRTTGDFDDVAQVEGIDTDDTGDDVCLL